MIKIIHTADNHIGKRYKSGNYTPAVQEKLVLERLQALQRVVAAGNEKEAHFLVVAGDLFDTINVTKQDIRSVVDIFNQFTGEAVLVLPGNHDFYQAGSDTLWGKFTEMADHSSKIHLLNRSQPEHFSISDTQVIFYPCPCESKHSETHVMGWVQPQQKDPNALHIGIAHGNVEGLGLGGDKYFNMTRDQLKQAGMDCWLLGHIHVPFPLKNQLTHDGFFFPATHTPDGFDCSGAGYCWYLEIDDNKQIKMEQLVTGKIRFMHIDHVINSGEDAKQLVNILGKNAGENVAVRLTVQGRLPASELNEFREALANFQPQYLHLSINDDLLLEAIDQAFIEANYVTGSMPHTLLTNLANKQQELALQLAQQLIKDATV